jgi:hypothetical protein
MKAFPSALLILCALNACAPAKKNLEISKVEAEPATYCRSTTTCPFRTLVLSGLGTNVTVNMSTGVTMEISCEKGVLTANGEYDSENLIGKFTALNGKLNSQCYGSDSSCLHFDGELKLDVGSSGYPAGSKAPYKMTIAVSADGAQGTYWVGPHDSRADEQFGKLELFKVKSRSNYTSELAPRFEHRFEYPGYD